MEKVLRLIDANELRDHWLYDTVGNEPEYSPNDVLETIDDAPTVDAVPVIRCRDCRWYRPQRDSWGDCTQGDDWHQVCPDDFCSYGERRQNDETEV